jgi:glycosyltransferase involved in cell wall biosynthesis
VVPETKGQQEPIYIEVSSLLSKKLTGIGRYVARMIEALSSVASLRLVTTITDEQARAIGLHRWLLCGQEIRIPQGELPPVNEEVGEWVKRMLRRSRHAHDCAEASRHAGVYTMLRPDERHFGREVCFLYDFTPAILPWTHLPGTCEHYGIFFTRTSGYCDRGIAISRSTQSDARWLCALPPERVSLGYPGPSLCIGEHLAQGVERSSNVILVVSTLEPRKNGRFLLDWYMHSDALPEDMELRWVGPRGWISDGAESMTDGKRGRRVRFLGMVSDRELCRQYQEAAFSVYPSLYEGFGFPVLDSLWHGTRVLSSLNSSLQEFAVPGVHFFDACDAGSLDEAYGRMTRDQGCTIDRDQLRKRFSWDQLAQVVLKACA